MSNNYNYFIPRTDGDLGRWAAAYKEKITILGPSLGLTPAEITEQETAAQSVVDTMNRITVKKQEQQEAVSLKKVIKNRELKQIANMAARIKRTASYTENMGSELGIVSSPIITQRATLKPALKLVVYPDHVQIAFTKQNQTGITIFSRIKGTTNWTKLISGATVSPYLDYSPLQKPDVPEVREYQARYWDNGTEIGQDSDVVIALFGK
ncbi:hypothetical protein SAMN05421788_1011132 [Filimonas lacunae]|uniref:Uncharacterized protein n=1 Tax=Filimonas lacunae TaxID=477680 RepID=A0A173MPS7_9BACT|nr:hypothetical protein [Filimonas lacunae]BAV09695.1 hypothetical protein FLA_5748 [Filimonas lacunae]SIS77406.1 hypothetical protein SAMN05421788_1011132 [Filimonas lacunae]